MDTAPSQQIDYVADHVHITDYEEVREVLRSRDFVQGAFVISAPHFLQGTLTMLDGDEHLARRRIEARLFSEHALSGIKEQALLPIIEEALDDLRSTGRDADGVVRADLVPLTWRMLYRIAARVTGIDGVDTEERTARLVQIIQDYGRALTVEWATEPAGPMIEAGHTARATFEREFFAASAERRRALVAEYRAGNLEADQLPTDLLTLLYLHRDDEWDEELPLREVSLFMVGSTQTTAQAFPHLVDRLERWFDVHPDERRLTTEDPDFLPSAVFESLRLFVASPARIRLATTDVRLETSGRLIPAGQRVALWFLPASSDPEVFGEAADRFNPHREVKGAPWGLAFGGGDHACIGRPLVTGVTTRGGTDGTLVTMARHLYAAGLRRDPEREARKDPSTHYDSFASLPVILLHL